MQPDRKCSLNFNGKVIRSQCVEWVYRFDGDLAYKFELIPLHFVSCVYVLFMSHAESLFFDYSGIAMVFKCKHC